MKVMIRRDFELPGEGYYRYAVILSVPGEGYSRYAVILSVPGEGYSRYNREVI